MRWRKFNKMDQVRQGKIPKDMMKIFYFESTGFDKEGCPSKHFDDIHLFLYSYLLL